MRSAIIGVCLRDDPVKRREFTLATCRVTHTDQRAEESALLVAEAAALASHGRPMRECQGALEALIVSEEMKSRFAMLRRDLGVERSVAEYAADIGCGERVSGFAPNTVAVALYAWLRHRNDFETALRQVIACGGDTDTVAAITGGIGGAEVGEEGIPKVWIDGICDWPRSVSYVRRVARELRTREAAYKADVRQRTVSAPRQSPPRSICFAIGVLLRNFAFLLIVLAHGFRRLLPPY